MLSDNRFIDAMAIVGSADLSPTVCDILEEYVCCMYGFKNETDINKVRYKMFTSRKKLPDPQKLPPTHDAFLLHFARVNYQVFEWKQALDKDFILTDPDGEGWVVIDGKLFVKWMTELPAPESILEFVSCGCKKNKCKTGLCRCFSVNLHCTSLCDCQNCDNCDNEQNDDSDTSEDEGDSTSDESMIDDD